MKKTKLTVLALALVMGIGMLSGCSEEDEPSMEFIDAGALASAPLPQISVVELGNGDGNSNAANNAGSDDPISDNSISGSVSGTQSGGNSGASENKTAEIVIPNVTEYGTYIAECNIFDPEKIKSALLGNVDITPVIRDYSKDDPYHPYPIYAWDNEDTHLNVNNNSPGIGFLKESANLIRMYFVPPRHNGNGSVDNYEHVNDELDFCTREQAVKNVKETLVKMGLSVSDSADVYTLCQKDLQKLVDEDIAAGGFYDLHTSMKDLNRKPLTSYTVDKSQEGYYIVFKQEHGGVPVYNLHLPFKSVKELTIFHPDIRAVYSADGLVLLDVFEYRGDLTETGKVTQLISPESAAQVVTKKYSDMGASRVEFNKVELMYVLTPNTIDGKINITKAKLIPAWVCSVNYTQWTIDKELRDYADVPFKETILIDAQTGAEII